MFKVPGIASALLLFMTGCWAQEIDPMDCYRLTPEDCLTRSEPDTCHQVPAKNWIQVYNFNVSFGLKME